LNVIYQKKAFEKCEDSIKCINQNGGNIIKYEIEQLIKKKIQLKLKLEEYNNYLGF
jgi:hypothetical protein